MFNNSKIESDSIEGYDKSIDFKVRIRLNSTK